MKFHIGSIIPQIVFIAIVFIGYGLNIYKFASADFEEPYKEEILRGIGIPFGPLGIIIGYMDIGSENE